MYLFIFEDGDIKYRDCVEDGDLMAADDGLLDIVDIRLHGEPKRYWDGKWQAVEAV